ncbi:MAG: acetyltransferase, partial [Alphaproteobacteria bacterium]|nr:acetyltransferase [Alphaproteobacteria bacterium]
MSRNKSFYIIGGGGQAKVIIAAAHSPSDVCGIFDYDKNKIGKMLLGELKISNAPSLLWWHEHRPAAIIAVGDNIRRKKIAEELGKQEWINVIHPSATVHSSAKIGIGIYIGANAIIQPDAVIGDHAIINTSSIIEHDVKIGAYSHIAPGCVLAGNVEIGEGAFLGTGTHVIPCQKIGCWTIIGAGSAVVKNIPS